LARWKEERREAMDDSIDEDGDRSVEVSYRCSGGLGKRKKEREGKDDASRKPDDYDEDGAHLVQ